MSTALVVVLTVAALVAGVLALVARRQPVVGSMSAQWLAEIKATREH